MKVPRYIYFIRPVGADGPIKIGCSEYPEERLRQIARWSPLPLEIVARVNGSFDLERNIHQCFADAHSHLEWFNPTPRLVAAIDQLVAGHPIGVAIDLSDKRGAIRVVAGKPRQILDVHIGRQSYQMKLVWALKRAGNRDRKIESLPDDVTKIMSRWEGYQGNGSPKTPKRPTEEEFARLDEVIADPVAHCWSRAQRLAAEAAA